METGVEARKRRESLPDFSIPPKGSIGGPESDGMRGRGAPMELDRDRLVVPDPGAVPFDRTVLKLWGDDASGRVNDWIYVSTAQICQLVFSMPPGARFGHSDKHRTVYGADELYYVLRGLLVLANPETGEVHRVGPGEAVVFGPDTWHHGFSRGNETLEVLEYFAPPPATGSSERYSRTRPFLERATYVQDERLERWPADAEIAVAKHTQRVLGDREVLWRLEGEEHWLLVGIYLSTPRLTVARGELLPGQRSETIVRGGDQAGYVLDGRLNLFLPDHRESGEGNGWFQIEAGDGFFIPAGMAHRFYNMTDAPVRFMFGVAPRYLPETG
jgi:mannose-6-phosphate isomerase-like protein (cupin superfamily)